MSRLQMIYHLEPKIQVSLKLFAAASVCGTREILFLPLQVLSGVQHCFFSMDSDLEAFSRNPTGVSFAVLAVQLAAFTKCLNEVFLSY
jgi:hypothetical protein